VGQVPNSQNWVGSLGGLVTTPTRFARELEMLTLPIWAELAEEADPAGWLADPSDDYYSEDRVERRYSQDRWREHAAPFM